MAHSVKSAGRLDWSRVRFTPNLDENIARMNEIFQNDNTLNQRLLICRADPTIRCALFYFDGMVNASVINESLAEPVLCYQGPPVDADELATKVLEIRNSHVESDAWKALSSMMSGDTLVFVDGDSRPVVGDTKGFSLRSVDEPDNERVLQGPREGFNENMMTNLSLIRRRLKTPDFKCSFRYFGTETHTVASVCYIEGLCDQSVLAEFQRRLDRFDLDSALDANYLIECCRDAPLSPFPTMGVTERPDIVAAKLLEGRVALVLDGTPVAITAPHLLLESFQTNDDYYLSFFYTNVSRLLRILGFFLTILAPAVYLALVQHHPEMVPTRLLLSISASTEGVPLPALFEALLLLIIFEILKETGLRTPSGIGQALSIVGGLVLGQAAVEARFVSAPMVIVIAFAGTTALMVPKLKTASLLLRFVLLIAAAALGLYGVFLVCALVLLHVCGLSTFGVPYLTNIISVRADDLRDVYLRFPWFSMKRDKRFLAGNGADEEDG